MKYLKNEIYPTYTDSENVFHSWQAAVVRYQKAFNRIKHNFSQSFLFELKEGHAFHDSSIRQLSITPHDGGFRLDLILSDGYEPETQHIMTFQKVDHIVLSEVIGQDWLYSEILPQKQARFSLEVAFSNNGMLYIEFEKLEYSCKL